MSERRERAGYRFIFTVHDPDVVEVMRKLERKRGIFIEVAVREFLKTDKGLNFLSALLSEYEDDFWEEGGAGGKGKKRGGSINFDDFFG